MADLDAGVQQDLVRAFSEELDPPEVLIVDTGAGIDHTVQTFVAACQTVVVVVCDEPASLTDSYALMKVMRNEKGVRRFEILANQVETPSQGRGIYDRLTKVTDKYLDVELGYLGAVPSDNYLRRAVQERRPLVSLYPRAPAAAAIRDVGRRLTRQSLHAEAAGVGFFVEQLLAQQQKQSAVRH
jgi:flagellar biosynthesis protein FlhG